MRKTLLTIVVALFATPVMANIANEYHLVLEENFDKATLVNSEVWKIAEGNGCPENCFFGNNEKQTYTRDTQNLRIEANKLVIEAHHQEGLGYTSAKITSQKLPGWTYGKIAVRAKLPEGRGTWPAIWMLPDQNTYGGWPKSGEIDIMEHVGFNPGRIHGTIHTQSYNHRAGTQKGGEIQVPTSATKFHTYSIVWNEQSIQWFIDDNPYFEVTKQDDDTVREWPFDDPFHLIVNLAVGGDWGGKKGIDQHAFPTRLEVDWIKVWQQTPIN